METLPLMAALAVIASAPLAYAQSASTLGAGSSTGSSGTVGSGGSAAAGGTSASTLGLGGSSTGPAGTSSSIGGAGSAATDNGGKATSSDKVHDNPNMMHDQAKAHAQNGGTWSKSMTDAKLKQGELDSRTKSMSHELGGPPAKSTTTESVPMTR